MATTASATCLPWGPGTTRFEASYGMNLNGPYADLSWSSGKRRFDGADPARSPTRQELLRGGVPTQGLGADLALAAGKRRVAPPVGNCTRLEGMAGHPLSGGGADIDRTCHRGRPEQRSSPPPPASFLAQECRILHDKALVGRGRRPKAWAEKPRAPRRSCSPRAGAACAIAMAVSPSRGSVTCGKRGKLCRCRKTRSSDDLDSCATTSIGSMDSMDMQLTRSIETVRALQCVADATPLESNLRPALDAEVRDKMDVAWEAVCAKLRQESRREVCASAQVPVPSEPARAYREIPAARSLADILAKLGAGDAEAGSASTVDSSRDANTSMACATSGASFDSCVCAPPTFASAAELAATVERALFGLHSAHMGDIDFAPPLPPQAA